MLTGHHIEQAWPFAIAPTSGLRLARADTGCGIIRPACSLRTVTNALRDLQWICPVSRQLDTLLEVTCRV